MRLLLLTLKEKISSSSFEIQKIHENIFSNKTLSPSFGVFKKMKRKNKS
jgi:hypothetical protein